MAEEEIAEEVTTVPATAGGELRAAREASGLTLQQVSASTRISQRHLAAIENDAFAELPGRTYAIGFARTYARQFGLDEKVIAAKVREQLDKAGVDARPRIATFEPGDPARVPSRSLGWLSALAVVLVLGALFVVARAYLFPAADLPPLAGETPSAAASTAPAASAASSAGEVTFTARADGVWVKFYDGAGNQLMQKEMALGEVYTIPAGADRPQLWTARPDALDVTVGGRQVARISDQQRTVRDVAVDAASLLARAAPAAPAATRAATPPRVSAEPALAEPAAEPSPTD